MSHKKHGQLTTSPEWARHLRPLLRRFLWKGERRAEWELVLAQTLYPRIIHIGKLHVKPRHLLTYLIVIFGLFSNAVYCDVQSSSAPIGRWEIEKKHSSGATIKIEMEITVDNKFSGVMFINGVANWAYGGTWSLSNNEFTYIYTESSKPLPEDYHDTDIIISISEKEYTYKSKLSGEVNTYHRMK